GLDEQVTVDGVEGAVAGAAAQLDVAGLSLDLDVGAARLQRRVAQGGEYDVDAEGVVAEDPAPAGLDHGDGVTALLDDDVVGVLALDRDHGLADGVGALDVHVALADLDDQVDRAGGLELVLGHGSLLVRVGEKGCAAPPGRRPAWQGAYRGS